MPLITGMTYDIENRLTQATHTANQRYYGRTIGRFLMADPIVPRTFIWP